MNPLTLADQGQSAYQIVIAASACDAERYAAEELAYFLREMTTAEFPIKRDDAPSSDFELAVGNTNRLTLDDLPPELKPQAWEGFAIVRDNAKLLIVGNMPRATLYGVYDFLHEELGCRFLTPEVNHVPGMPRLSVAVTSRRYDPPMEYREIWNGISHQPQHAHSSREKTRFDDVWAARNHLNLMGSSPAMEAMLGKIKWVGPSFVHTFNYLLPVEQYFDEHPEYFAEIGGTRVREYAGQIPQLCLTNPEVMRICVDGSKKWIDAEAPNAQSKFFVSITISDTENFCKCARCVAINEEEGVEEGGTKMRFVNDIAAALASEYPNVVVETMIYKTTVPKKTRPVSNVIIRNVSGINWHNSLDDLSCPASVRTLDRFRELKEATGDRGIYNWSKHVQFDDFLRPFPNLRCIARNFRIMHEHGVVGTFAQNQQSRGAEMQDLRFYLLARAMWRPEVDSRETMEEFCRLYYGAAADTVLRYINFLHDEYGDKAPELEDIDERFVTESDAILAEAEAIAETGEIRQRVATLRLPVWNLILNSVYGQVGKVLSFPVEWFFKIDADEKGYDRGWEQTTDFAAWGTMRIDRHWTLQGENHRGVAWYAMPFDMPDTNGAPLAICFGAIDGKCDVFVDGRKVGEQKVKADMSWMLTFFVGLEDGLAAGRHVMVIRVDKNYENSGIWQPITIVDMSAPLSPEVRTVGQRFLEVAREAKLANVTECYGEPGLQVETMLYPCVEFFLKHGT